MNGFPYLIFTYKDVTHTFEDFSSYWKAENENPILLRSLQEKKKCCSNSVKVGVHSTVFGSGIILECDKCGKIEFIK